MTSSYLSLICNRRLDFSQNTVAHSLLAFLKFTQAAKKRRSDKPESFLERLNLPCPTTLTFRTTDKVWHMFKGRRLSKDEMGYDRVLSQLVKLAFDMSYKLLLLNRLFNVEIHKNTKIVYFVDFSV